MIALRDEASKLSKRAGLGFFLLSFDAVVCLRARALYVLLTGFHLDGPGLISSMVWKY